jgi:hypothetical protein
LTWLPGFYPAQQQQLGLNLLGMGGHAFVWDAEGNVHYNKMRGICGFKGKKRNVFRIFGLKKGKCQNGICGHLHKWQLLIILMEYQSFFPPMFSMFLFCHICPQIWIY